MQSNWNRSPGSLPVSQASMLSTKEWRKPTDVACSVVSALFAIAMFITACVMWNRESFAGHFAGYFGPSTGQLCETGYLILANPADFDSRSCVTVCPGGFEQVEGVCLPLNAARREDYMMNNQISSLVIGSDFLKFLLNSLLIAVGVGLLRVVLTNLAPRKSADLDFYISILLLIATGVLLLVLFDKFWNTVTPLKIAAAVVCFLIAGAITILACLYANQIKLQGLFIEYAVLYLRRNVGMYLYVLLFMVLSAGLVALIVWQHCCFVANKGGASMNFVQFNSSGLLGVLNVLEFIWGMQFLRDAFNFCVAGKAADYYWRRDEGDYFSSLVCLVKHHWGTVVFGSFLNAFFLIPSMLIDALRCHPKTLCSGPGQTCNNYFSCYSYLFDRVRTDVYSYTASRGLPYCSSAADCRAICQQSQLIVGVHSPIRNYRFTAHVVCTAVTFILCWLVLRASVQYYGVWECGVLVVLIVLVITWFISVFSDAAEGLQTCFLVERQLQPNYEQMQGLLPEFRADLEHRDRKIRKDGNC